MATRSDLVEAALSRYWHVLPKEGTIPFNQLPALCGERREWRYLGADPTDDGPECFWGFAMPNLEAISHHRAQPCPTCRALAGDE